MIINYDASCRDGVIDLWNSIYVEDGYKELTTESFIDIFENNRYFDPQNTFVRLDNNCVTGFACGCTGEDLVRGEISGYITCILLQREYQSKDNFRELLELLEQSFRTKCKRTSEVLFFNPIKLPWYIPGTKGHEHNNTPGAAVDSLFYKGLLENGYVERTREMAMYLPLKDFSIPDDIVNKEQQAVAHGYEVNLFDKSKHFGLSEFLKALNNPLWEEEITSCTLKGTPVIVACNKGRIAGFAGPVAREQSGRGYFAGIGVHPDHEGNGLGSILFFRLCQELKNIGAEYMSLYTGKENKAINIYKKAGFKVVKEFSVMRKEL